MKNSKSLKSSLGAILFAAFFVGGCANTIQANLEQHVKLLEREVAQLGSEKNNWNARSRALDDEVVVLKKKLQRCHKREDKRKLQVIRLSKSDEVDQAPEIEDERDALSDLPTFEQTNGRRKNGKSREVLVLRGGMRRAAPGSSRPAPRAARPANSQMFSGYGPESLGVANAKNGATTKPIETFNTAYRAYANRKYAEALDTFSEFIRANPAHAFTDDAVFWRGECYLGTGKFFKAMGEFERLLRRYPGSDKRSSSLYRIGFSWDRLGDQNKALEYYFQVVDGHRGTEAARKASRRVSTIKGEGKQASNIIPAAVR
jgi:tol-pal system protein YbgF